MKTIVELFDECQINNVIAALKFLPEKIVYIGFKNTMTQAKCDAIRNFFKKSKIKIEFEIVGRYDFDDIAERLKWIINNNEDCWFDLTGGKEIVLAAMGAISERYDVPMFQIDVKRDRLIRIKNCAELLDEPVSPVSIYECLMLHGGMKKHSDESWDLNDDFMSDIDKLWKICNDDIQAWNRQTHQFGTIANLGYTDDNLRVTAKVNDELMDFPLAKRLAGEGIICEYSEDGDVISFRYKNKQIQRCITKAGNILELYVYMQLKKIEKNNPGTYSDIDMGVMIDWNARRDEFIDTSNEVDVFVMKGAVPVFISCKNGEVRKDALYELETVAERFGGKYAKKVLIATYISHDRDSRRFILDRASKMGILVIRDLSNVYEILKDNI